MNPYIFAFPVNAAILAAILGLSYVLNREKGGSAFVRTAASGRTSVVLMAVFALCCLVIAFFPKTEFMRSWIFNIVLVCISINLFLAVLRYRGSHKIRFYLNHIGLLVVFASLSFGSADMIRLRTAVEIGETVETAYDRDGRPHSIGYPVTLDSFDAGIGEGDARESFSAAVTADGVRRILRVNRPYVKSWKENIYLYGYDRQAGKDSSYCILEFVIQPWKYLTFAGLIMVMAGSVLLLSGGRKKSQKQ